MKSEKECYNYNNSEQSFLDETTLLSGKSGCGQKQLNFIFSIVAAYYMAAQTCPALRLPHDSPIHIQPKTILTTPGKSPFDKVLNYFTSPPLIRGI